MRHLPAFAAGAAVLAACPASGAKNAAPSPACLDDAWTSDPGLCVSEFAKVPGARGIAFAPNGDLFAVSRGSGLVVLFDANHDGAIGEGERAEFSKTGGNHGLALHDGFVYVSTDTDVLRLPYAPGAHAATGPAQKVIHGIPEGGHSTRTLLFDKDGKLLVSAGSAGNVDKVRAPDPMRSNIRRFDVTKLPDGGLAWTDGEVFATGLRNEVGLALDAQGRVWGVENGRDELHVGGKDIHEDNPAEEINRFDVPGRFFGYPFCWTEWKWADGKGPGTQHVDPDVTGGHDDAWCRDPKNVVPPVGLLQAHLAPLGLAFYDGAMFPEWKGQLVIPAHGSWNRDPPVGRTVLRAAAGADGRVGKAEPILGEKSADGRLKEGTWKHRPVDVKVGPDGALYVSDDFGGTILRVSRRK